MSSIVDPFRLSAPDLFASERERPVRLKTMLLLRWFAAAGQVAAALAAWYIWDLRFNVTLVGVAIGASVLLNLVCMALFDATRMLSEREAAGMITFDMLQLGIVLFLTGGLHNPFALLLLPPVTISATVMRLKITLPLGGLTLAVITALLLWYQPILSEEGRPMMLPQTWIVGFWMALMIGTIFLTLYAYRVTAEMAELSEALSATQLALAREQKLTDLGGVVAATAHELGTPLATIKLTAAELASELRDTPSLPPELVEDARLIAQSADRCRDILRGMGRAGNEDMQVRAAPVMAVLREAAEPHLARGKQVKFIAPPGRDRRQPQIWRRPEVIHGLRNLIQNAVDFAEREVRVEADWTETDIWLRISDDGRGFPPAVLARIGEPMQRRRRPPGEVQRRPGYEGMGLGLFIAKTLLERSGGRLGFANGALAGGPQMHGAAVTVRWSRLVLEAPSTGPLGPNLPLVG
ncbi:sensor histidine kinase RegB [Pseudoroseicyclus tamaricis]|uniref:histidine kinase n=1 Tax=Pseudoroseicyclus tamaricis TaxID=2705421 RepID=A0A6B2K294_9RHOB|nr:ActS/PrrB/RegB family redox-sensitive histidine kinase [Pseudoroseicyclus tamaricis]NDV02654.1 ActS/PrrB/RegB family redox-sensitive histidine kinase [Pseudoroseicyclus tamaricis]